MRKKLITGIIAGIILLAFVLTGCQSGGIAQDVFDQVKDQLETAQKQIEELQDTADPVTVTETASDLADELKSKLDTAEAEIAGLIDKYVLEGDTVADTVAKIAKYYHDTHEYSTSDLFVCSDMASEIWNMLKAKGINAIVAVGSLNRQVTDIVQCDHAWVLAEVAPNEYLAIETTAGVVVTKAENPNYYRGWYYDNPAKIKDYNFWVKEYNTRISIHNDLVAADEEAVALYNQNNSSSQLAIHNKLVELIEQMREDMNAIIAKINNLATPLNL